jgi:predicted unusual protein kinase regulating ubiquinone biosynthesis (AarF/ABC1/UbiB family)
LPASVVHKVLADELGENWRNRLVEFSDKAAGAASIGQVHRATWRSMHGDEHDVAVKVQYPGVAKALHSDLRQLSRLAKLFKVLHTGIDISAMAAEMIDRLDEELDYEREGASQRRFAAAFDGTLGGSEDIYVPKVLAATPRVLVTEWLTGRPLSAIITDGTQAERDRVGAQLVRAVYSGPARTGLMHADPHPGNFLVLPDGRLGMLDFGAVKELPDGLPAPLGILAGWTVRGDGEQLLASLVDVGFLPADTSVSEQEALDYFAPMCEMFEADSFAFSRTWLRHNAAHLIDPRTSTSAVGRQLALPADYFTVHRVVLGVMGVLSQLGAVVPMRLEEMRWAPEFREIVDPAWEELAV